MNMLRWGGAALVACALAALPGPASANVQVGSSGWQWGNPLPQGNRLSAMSFVGTTGYAVGDFGTLLQTTDGGTTWSGLPAGTFSNLSEVQAVDATTMVAGGGCVARRTVDGGRTFARIAFTPVESSCPPDSQLAGLWFISGTTGYVVLADGTVAETTDGGTEFKGDRTAIPGTRKAGGRALPTDVVFRTEQTGFATTTDGKIFQTTDAAITWKPVSDTNRAVRAITFVDDNVGYAVGEQSLFLKTTDGGATWTPKDSGAPAPQDYTSIRCASPTLCVATTKSGTVLARTADGGDTFTFPTPSTAPIYAAAFASPTRLVAAGLQGATVTSDDAGLNFTPVGGRLDARFTRIRAGAVAGTAYAPGPNGTLGKTTDGGRTWTRGNVLTSQDVRDVSFPTANVGYALDTDGGLFSTSSAGATWKTLDTGTTARPNAVYAPSPTVVMVIGPTGIRRSVDGGGSFAAVKGNPPSRTQLDEVDRAGSAAIVAYGFQDVLRSTDQGKTWKALRKPGTYVRRNGRLVNRLGIRRVDFVDATNGFLLDATGRLWKTRNAGKSWTELAGVGTSEARGMSFSSAQKGYLVISRFGSVTAPTGFLLRTNDGGATWHPQFVVADPIADNGVAAGGATDYLLGGQSSLLASTTGGDAGSASTLTIKAPKSKYSKPAHITVTGKLTPASGNELVTVAYRRPGSTRWRTQTVKAGANGAFTTSWDLAKGANLFVAQWQGDFRSRGDGSPVLTVTVGAAKGK
jgi:photosystem II stability/assembly factor-like uncharacterized protein